jgi:hypothetical protein
MEQIQYPIHQAYIQAFESFGVTFTIDGAQALTGQQKADLLEDIRAAVQKLAPLDTVITSVRDLSVTTW